MVIEYFIFEKNTKFNVIVIVVGYFLMLVTPMMSYFVQCKIAVKMLFILWVIKCNVSVIAMKIDHTLLSLRLKM